MSLSCLDATDAAVPQAMRDGPRPWGLHRAVAQRLWQAPHPMLALEAARRYRDFLAGVQRWRQHPWRRPDSGGSVIWQDGSTTLIDHGLTDHGGAGRAVLLVPSLINRAHILDLMPGHSFLQFLKNAGLRPLLVDWAAPGDAEARFRLDDYIAGRLEAAAEAARAATGGPVAVLGYCMGGLLALALALRRPELVARLALFATPWDFHAGPDASRTVATWLALRGPEPGLALSVEAIQTMIALLDPALTPEKFRRFGAEPGSPAGADRFVAVEDWVNDGVTLTGGVAAEVMLGWYGENRPARGQWMVGDVRIDPAGLAMPALAVIPAHDRLVPDASARALASALPDGTIRTPALGHVGMIVAGAARRLVWQPTARWLLS